MECYLCKGLYPEEDDGAVAWFGESPRETEEWVCDACRSASIHECTECRQDHDREAMWHCDGCDAWICVECTESHTESHMSTADLYGVTNGDFYRER